MGFLEVVEKVAPCYSTGAILAGRTRLPGGRAGVDSPPSPRIHVVDETQRKNLRNLLGELSSRREHDRNVERDRALERHRHVDRFTDLKRQVLVPILREFMIDLERSGHLTRLRTSAREKVRLDVQLQTAPPQRGALELALHSDPSSLRIDYAWGWRVAQEVIPLDQVDEKLLADRVLHFLRGLS
jgi:hypothetical protein